MAKSRGTKKKGSVPSKKSVRAMYDCDDVERYLDKAIRQVKKEIVPRIQSLDERDKTQYDTAKKIIIDANDIMLGRQKQVEDSVRHMETDLNEIYASRKEMVDNLTSSFEALHQKLDSHILDESKEFQEIRTSLNKAASHVEAIQDTLDNVSANGNKGLSASFTDMYNKLQEMERVTQGARARARFYTVLHDVVVTTPLLKPLKYKWGGILYAGVILVILNTILHTLGIDLDLVSFFKWLFTLGRDTTIGG